MIVEVLNYFDEVVVQVQLLQRRVPLKARYLINLVEGEDECLQIDEALEVLYLFDFVIKEV